MAKRNKHAHHGNRPARSGTQHSDRFRQTLVQAMEAQKHGDLDTAQQLYQSILDKHPNNVDALLYLGTVHYNRKEFQKAIELIDKAQAQKKEPEAAILINRGLVLDALGRSDEAIPCLKEAIELNPKAFQAYFNLGNTYFRLRQYKNALPYYERALELIPSNTLVKFQYACALQELFRYEECMPLFAEINEVEPQNSRSLCAYGICLSRKGKKWEARKYVEQALALNPNNAAIRFNYAHLLKEMGDTTAAKEQFEQALLISPNNVEALLGLGRLLIDSGDHEGSRPYIERAIQIDPGYYSGLASLGLSYLKNNAPKSLECFDEALKLKPDADDALMLKAFTLNLMGRSREAEEFALKAIALRPNNADYYQNLGNIVVIQGRVTECLEYCRKALELNPKSHLVYSNLLLYSHYTPNASKEDLWQLHQEYQQLYAQPHQCPPPEPLEGKNPDRRLRIGLVSADFRKHSVAYFVEPLLRAHNREMFEYTCYANVKTADRYTDILSSLSDRWRNIITLSDNQAAQMIRDDNIDILIDLCGHTADNRLMVMARKPAPVQANWLGYPDTTGMNAIDYRIADAYTDPPEFDRFSSEKVVRLPGGFHCYCPFPNSPELMPPPSKTNGYVTFGSFNNFAKTSDEVALLWVEIMHKIPHSRLLLKSLGLGDPKLQEDIIQRLSRLGIDQARLEILPKTISIADHFKTYNRVDIALDTWPYTGTTTTFEALWMGVPVITLLGSTHCSRVGASILSNCGMQPLICHSPEEYISKAVEFAKDEQLRQELRLGMRARLRESPLLDENGFARKFEAALRSMWLEYCGVENATEDLAGFKLSLQASLSPWFAGLYGYGWRKWPGRMQSLPGPFTINCITFLTNQSQDLLLLGIGLSQH